MSDTPSELYDMMVAITDATGRVLVNGLGLGIFVLAIAKKKYVTHIDVVEIDADLIKLVGPLLASKVRGVELQIHCADALKKRWKRGTCWDYAWHDIWDNICSDNLPEMAKLHRKYGRMARKQASWCKLMCQAQK